METLAAVLLQLNLFDAHTFSDNLVLLLPTREAVLKHAIHRNGPSLLRDLVSRLKR